MSETHIVRCAFPGCDYQETQKVGGLRFGNWRGNEFFCRKHARELHEKDLAEEIPMIDRIAAALLAQYVDEDNEAFSSKNLARTALETMRDPSLAMLDAGYEADQMGPNGYDAMIEEALK